MYTKLTKTVICLTATLFCLSAQDELFEMVPEQSQELTLGSCKETKNSESCKARDKSCGKKKQEQSTRKGAAKRVLDGS